MKAEQYPDRKERRRGRLDILRRKHTVTIERKFDEGFEALNEHYNYTVKIDRQPKLSIGSPASGVAAEFTNTYQPTYTLSFDMQGHGAPVDLQHVKAGDKAEKPVDPTETGYTFQGWYAGSYDANNGFIDLGYAFDFENTAITADTILYAKREEIAQPTEPFVVTISFT